MLLLLLMDVELNVISKDYVSSEGFLAVEFEARMVELREIGLGEDFAGCPQGFVEEVHSYLIGEYRSVRGYLGGIGVDEGMQDTIRGNIMGT